MDFKLELVAIPVSDVDRAKAFYTEQAGFNADHDHTVGDDIRFVRARCRACSWSSLTSTPPTTSWPGAASR